MHSYILWALLGMAGYSVTTVLVKLAERTGEGAVSPWMILAVATTIVPIFAIGIVALRGELKTLVYDLETGPLLWAVAAGITLTIAVSSLFHALSLGPANAVVPIYGMFIVVGPLLAVPFLGEAFTWNKVAGLVAAVIGVVLISL